MKIDLKTGVRPSTAWKMILCFQSWDGSQFSQSLMVKNVYQSFEKVKKWKTDISDKCLGITKSDIFMYLAQRVKTFQSI